MDIARLIIVIHCSLLGIAVSLLLIALLLRQRDRDPSARIGIILGAVVCTMYFSICLNGILAYYGYSRKPWLAHRAMPLLTAIVSFLPAIILWSWRRSPVLKWESRISAWLLVLACISGCAVIVTAIWFGPVPLQNRSFDRLIALNAVLCLIPAAISILNLPLDARLKTFMKATSVTYILATSISVVFAPAFGSNSAGAMIASFLLQAGLLIGLFGSFIVAARFRLSDVFVRWSARIIVVGVLTLLGTLSIVVLWTEPDKAHHLTSVLLCSGELAALLILGVVLTERCSYWVECHVLQRLDLDKEAHLFQDQIFRIENANELIEFTELELTRRLEVRGVRVVSRNDIPTHVLASGATTISPLEINSIPSGFTVDSLEGIDVLIPIPEDGKSHQMLAVAAGPGRQSLNSGEITFLKDLCHTLGVRLHHLEVESFHRRQALRETLLQQQLTEAELRALRAQVNPHFLFNSLNTIADLIVRDPDSAEEMTLQLSRIFRHVLAQSDRQFVPLRDEFEFLRDYLNIEQARFGKNLQIQLTLDPKAANVDIPTLLLQPLVENALKHGLAKKGGPRSLLVSARLTSDRVLIEVSDDGVGFDAAVLRTGIHRSQSGVGLSNIRARLQTVYGDEGALEISSFPMKGCRVSVSIPDERFAI